MEHHKMVAAADEEAVTKAVYDVSEAFYRLPVNIKVQSGGLNCTAEEEAGNAIRFSSAHFSKHYIEMDASKSVDSFLNGMQPVSSCAVSRCWRRCVSCYEVLDFSGVPTRKVYILLWLVSKQQIVSRSQHE